MKLPHRLVRQFFWGVAGVTCEGIGMSCEVIGASCEGLGVTCEALGVTCEALGTKCCIVGFLHKRLRTTLLGK